MRKFICLVVFLLCFAVSVPAFAQEARTYTYPRNGISIDIPTTWTDTTASASLGEGQVAEFTKSSGLDISISVATRDVMESAIGEFTANSVYSAYEITQENRTTINGLPAGYLLLDPYLFGVYITPDYLFTVAVWGRSSELLENKNEIARILSSVRVSGVKNSGNVDPVTVDNLERHYAFVAQYEPATESGDGSGVTSSSANTITLGEFAIDLAGDWSEISDSTWQFLDTDPAIVYQHENGVVAEFFYIPEDLFESNFGTLSGSNFYDAFELIFTYQLEVNNFPAAVYVQGTTLNGYYVGSDALLLIVVDGSFDEVSPSLSDITMTLSSVRKKGTSSAGFHSGVDLYVSGYGLCLFGGECTE